MENGAIFRLRLADGGFQCRCSSQITLRHKKDAVAWMQKVREQKGIFVDAFNAMMLQCRRN